MTTLTRTSTSRDAFLSAAIVKTVTSAEWLICFDIIKYFKDFGGFLTEQSCRVVDVAGLIKELPVDGSDGQTQSEAAEIGPHL